MSFLKSDNTAGGLAKLYILRLAHFQGVKWLANLSSYFLNDVNNYLEPFYFTQDTGSYSVKQKKGAYQVSISAIYPGHTAAFEELEGTPFLLVGVTANHQYILFGDASNYFIYDYNQDGGSDFTDLAQIKLELKRNMMFKPRYILDPFSFELSDPENVSINGLFSVGETLTATFTAAAITGDYQTLYNWYVADDKNGTNEELVQSGNTNQYVTELRSWGKYIRVTVQLTSQSSESLVATSAYYFINTLDNQFHLYTNMFDIELLDETTSHYLFTGTNYGESGSFALLSSAHAFEVKGYEHLYFSFDYKINGDTFYGIEAWPANYLNPASIAVGRIHGLDVSSSEVNTWVQVSGYIASNQDFNSYIIKTGLTNSIPPEVSQEIKNFKCWKVEA